MVGVEERNDSLAIHYYLQQGNLIVQATGQFELELWDLKGSMMYKQLCRSGESGRISTEALSTGIYALRVRNSKGEISVQKVVIP